jgi:DNA (cytosine-5)-methyltransferase 1
MRHGSLFSGIGGFDLAARWMGWDNVFHVEWNPWCSKVLEHHFPNSESFTDVKQFDGSAWRGRVDIISGGFPCQPYSAAGKRMGKDDERHLWPEMLRIIREAAPAYVVGENVRGLTNWNGGVVFEEVCADLEAAGYDVWTGILPAAGVGAPHRLDRIWFVAHAHSGADLRTPGRNAGTGTGEGVPERHEVRIPDQSGDVWHAADTACSISERTRDARPGWDGFTDNGGDGHAADTDGIRFKERITAAESSAPRFGAGHGGADAANADDVRLQHPAQPGSMGASEGEARRRAASSAKAISRERDAPNAEMPRGARERIAESRQGEFDRRDSRAIQTDFEQFPTQPPICGGNDGLPRELDGITFSKWRNESIKAYGNAIVPQLAYQIFKAIQQTHEN